MTGKPLEPYFVYTTDAYQISITTSRPFAHRLRHPQDMVSQCSDILFARNISDVFSLPRHQLLPRKRSVLAENSCTHIAAHQAETDRRQDSLCAPGCRYPGVHHPSPQARARPLIQKASSLGRQIRDRLCPKNNGNQRRATGPQTQPGCLGSGNQDCSPSSAGETRECVEYAFVF